MKWNHLMQSLRCVALAALACLCVALPVSAGDGGDGGWINLPGSVGGPGNPINGPGGNVAAADASLVVTGRTAREVLGNPLAMGAVISGNFTVSVRADGLLSRDRAFVQVASRMVGGLGVLQVAGLPPVPFTITGERIDLPIPVFQALAAAGTTSVTLRLLSPELDRLVEFQFDIAPLNSAVEPRLRIVGQVI